MLTTTERRKLKAKGVRLFTVVHAATGDLAHGVTYREDGIAYRIEFHPPFAATQLHDWLRDEFLERTKREGF